MYIYILKQWRVGEHHFGSFALTRVRRLAENKGALLVDILIMWSLAIEVWGESVSEFWVLGYAAGA